MRSTRSIEIPVTWHKFSDDTVVSGHEGYRQRTTVLQPYFYTRKERLDGATKGADPRTEQTTRESDWGNLAEL